MTHHLAPGVHVHGSNTTRETTQWEDVLVKHGIIPEDPHIKLKKEQTEEAAKRTETQKPTLLQKGVVGGTPLDELEDEARRDDEDEQVLAMLREARIRQLKDEVAKARFGEVERLSRDEFVAKVKHASETGGMGGTPMYVVLELFKPHIEASTVVSACINALAKANPDVLMVRMISDQCIENWPDANVPTVFVYYEGKLSGQLIGKAECGLGNVDVLHAALRMLKVPLKHTARDDDDDDEDHDTVRRLGVRKLDYETRKDEDW